jgi:TonB family protein
MLLARYSEARNSRSALCSERVGLRPLRLNYGFRRRILSMFESTKRIAISIVASIFVCSGIIGLSVGQSSHPPIVPPRPIKLVKPDCSTARSCHGIHGLVVIVVDVLTDGTVGDATMQSGDQRLAEDAIKAAKQCRFEPGKFKGMPTPMNFDLQYQF